MHHCTMYNTTNFLSVHPANLVAVSFAVQCTMMYKVMSLKKTFMYYVWTREIQGEYRR